MTAPLVSELTIAFAPRGHFLRWTRLPPRTPRAARLRVGLTYEAGVWRWERARGFRFSTHAVELRSRTSGTVLAAFAYNLPRPGELLDQGAWTAPRHRGRGYARFLWETALRLERPRRVRVTVRSAAGRALIRRVRATANCRRWTVRERPWT